MGLLRLLGQRTHIPLSACAVDVTLLKKVRAPVEMLRSWLLVAPRTWMRMRWDLAVAQIHLVPKRHLGESNQRLKPAVCPSRLILSPIHLELLMFSGIGPTCAKCWGPDVRHALGKAAGADGLWQSGFGRIQCGHLGHILLDLHAHTHGCGSKPGTILGWVHHPF